MKTYITFQTPRVGGHSPWDAIQAVDAVKDRNGEIVEGAWFVSTAGHGGYRLSPERLAEMPLPLRAPTPYSPSGWFEEDCDWALVALAFPTWFPFEAIRDARATCEGTAYLQARVARWQSERVGVARS